ncbi:hypothetical protein BDW66DRAFT_163182 [Aspergillus desertorum]
MFSLLFRLLVRVNMGDIRGLRLDNAFAVLAMNIFLTMQTVNIYRMGILSINIGPDKKTAMLVPENKMSHMIRGLKLDFMNRICYICYIRCLRRSSALAGTWHQHIFAGASIFCVAIGLDYISSHSRQPLYVEIAVSHVLYAASLGYRPALLKSNIDSTSPDPTFVSLSNVLVRVFIMVCTNLCAYYSLTRITGFPIVLGWADRECFNAAIDVSLPGIKRLFRNIRRRGHGLRFELDGVLPTKNMDTRVSSDDTEVYILERVKDRRPSTTRPPRKNDLAVHEATECTSESEQCTKDSSLI